MKIIVDKNVIKQLIDLGIRFTIVEDKPIKEVPSGRLEQLNKLYNRWNKQKKIGGKKGLPRTNKLLPTHKEAWRKLYLDICNGSIQETTALVSTGLKNYIEDIRKREDGGYGDHRFSLYEFIKQKNGLRKFLSQ